MSCSYAKAGWGVRWRDSTGRQRSRRFETRTIYRPLAELLIGSGLRISEALALKVSDLELEENGGVIVVYRSRTPNSVGSTKSDRFRSVEIGQGLSRVLRDHLARRGEMASGDQANAHVFVMPVRTRKRDQGRWDGNGDGQPMDRTTVSRDWHKAALEDPSLRDMQGRSHARSPRQH
jgi:integrase